MEIVQVVTSIENENAGPSYSVKRLADSLFEKGVRSRIMSVGTPIDITEFNGVSDERFPVKSGPLLSKIDCSPELARAISAAAHDGAILHVHGLWRMPNIYPGRAARRFHVPLIVSPRGMLGQAALEFSAVQKRLFWHLLQRRALNPVKCYHATAYSELEDIRNFGINRPVAIIPNGIDIPELDRSDKRRTGPREVLHLGRIHPKKGIDRLLKAWALLGEDNVDWILRIVGPSELGHINELRLIARDLNLTNVHFESAVHGEEKADVFSGAELFVLPTRHENFGMVVAEALAHGTPVISTIGAPWQGLEAEGCGWWIDHGPETLAATLRIAMTLTDKERKAMGARGLEWMRRDFSWESIGGKMLQLYLWCAGRTDQPDFVIT